MIAPELADDARLRDQLAQLVRSAALVAGCSSAAIYIEANTSRIEPLSRYGPTGPGCSIDDYRSIQALMARRDDGLLVVKDISVDATPLAQLPFVTERPPSLRFVAFFAIRNEVGEAIGLLVLRDTRPRSGLSAAKAYVLLALATQIAAGLTLHEMKLSISFKAGERLRLLESVVVHAKDSILITEAVPIDLPGPRIVYCNAAFTETTGYTEAEVLGKTPRLLQGVDTSLEACAKIRAALVEWKPIEIELLNYHKNGTPFWVELSIVPVADERGWYTHWISVQRDITDRITAAQDAETRTRIAEDNNEALRTLANDLEIALDAAEAAKLTQSAFLTNMSHEIRTPLNGVLGMTQVLLTDELTPTQRERLSIIRDSGNSLLAILNDVLDLAKIEAGRLEIQLTDFDMSSLVAGVCGAFTEQANRSGVSFGFTLADETRGIWRGDIVRLRQILYNLISNSLKFTSKGYVRVSLDFADNGWMRIRVSDTGIGIPASKVDELFSKFYQVDNSITRRFGGTGLGLSICRQICELLGGTISVDTQEGQGSTFTVSLPMEQVRRPASPDDGPKTSEDAAEGDQGGLAPGHLRVLVAEDNPVNQLVMRSFLQALSITPVVVVNGNQAVQAWETDVFDLILMDVQMPEMDGITATRIIRTAEARSTRPATPIIAVSASAMTHQVEEYLAAGMDGHVAKPIDAGALFAAMETALADAEARKTRTV